MSAQLGDYERRRLIELRDLYLRAAAIIPSVQEASGAPYWLGRQRVSALLVVDALDARLGLPLRDWEAIHE